MFRKHMIEKKRLNGASRLSIGDDWAVFEFLSKGVAETAKQQIKNFENMYEYVTDYDITDTPFRIAIINPNPKGV